MVEQARRGTPTPPIALPQGAAGVRARFEGRAVVVDDAVVSQLRRVCARVDTSTEARAEAGRDWWPLTVGWALDGEVPALAAAVARPISAAEVAGVLAVCHHARVPMTAMGGRSGVGGHTVPVFGGVQLDMTGLSGITAVDDESLLVDVAAGTFGDVLEDELREQHQLTLGHWPQSMALSTVGGWIACRSAGQYSTRYGKIEDMVVGLEVALADGRVITTGGAAPRSAAGPDLTGVFVGSEGTLGVITEARLRVHPVPPAERRAAFAFDTFAAGIVACRTMLRRGARPAVVRLYDKHESGTGFGAQGTNVLILLDEGDTTLVDATMAVASMACASTGGRPLDTDLVGRWWDRRQDISALEEAVQAGLTVDTIEVASRWSVLPTLYREVLDAVAAVEGTFLVSAHLSHAYGDGGCLYFTFAGQPAAAPGQSPRGPGEAYYRRVWDEVMARTVALGGAISHHHGIGLNRGRHLATALGPAYDVLLAVKRALDPNGVLNPGKLGLPSPFGEAPWP
jgi:alkyldihydroxyacetonephosphate synthase